MNYCCKVGHTVGLPSQQGTDIGQSLANKLRHFCNRISEHSLPQIYLLGKFLRNVFPCNPGDRCKCRLLSHTERYFYIRKGHDSLCHMLVWGKALSNLESSNQLCTHTHLSKDDTYKGIKLNIFVLNIIKWKSKKKTFCLNTYGNFFSLSYLAILSYPMPLKLRRKYFPRNSKKTNYFQHPVRPNADKVQQNSEMFLYCYSI